MRRGRWWLVGLIVFGWATRSIADPERNAKFYEKQFDRFSRVLAELGERDANEAVGADLEQIRTWISRAQAYLAAEKLSQIDPLLVRMRVKAEHVLAKVERLEAESAANKAEEAAEAAERAAEEARKAVKAAAARLEELEGREP